MHNIKYVNKSFERIFEIDEEHAVKMNLRQIIDKDDAAGNLSKFQSSNKNFEFK
jgi:hypothetical protein